MFYNYYCKLTYIQLEQRMEDFLCSDSKLSTNIYLKKKLPKLKILKVYIYCYHASNAYELHGSGIPLSDCHEASANTELFTVGRSAAIYNQTRSLPLLIHELQYRSVADLANCFWPI